MISAAALGADYEKAPMAEDVTWQLKGLCASGRYDPNLWSPLINHEEEAEKAKAICYQCPVMLTCQRWALDRKETHGVWGGLSEGDRQAIWTGRSTRRRYHRKTIHDLLGA
jgi:WhiB family redox-sensing transcriptional regulator